MFESASVRDRVIASAMRLAASRKWHELTLLDIAGGAGVGLVDMKGEFSSKTAILTAFARAVDDEVLKATPGAEAGQVPRDRIFEVVMRRLDVLGPYRAALRSIRRSAPFDPQFAPAYLNSQHWMLQAAGVHTEGIRGGVRLAGLASVYGQVFHTWLDDDDPGLARTMAALDRRLRRGETWLQGLDNACRGVNRTLCALRSRARPASPADAAGANPATPEVM